MPFIILEGPYIVVAECSDNAMPFCSTIRPDKLDLLFLISHFLDLGAGGRLLFITSLFN